MSRVRQKFRRRFGATWSATRRSATLVLAALALGAGACSEVSAPERGAEAVLTISANTAGTPIATMVVEVTAADITTPLVFNIEAVNGTASGTLAVRAGTARTFRAQAFNAQGVETHSGQATLDVRPGNNPAVTITLIPRAGGVPFVITIGGVVVTVTPTSQVVQLGGTVQLQATVVDGAAAALSLPVTWASSNPALATVSSTGLVTTLLPGEVEIVATAGGEGARATIEITGEPIQWVAVTAGHFHTCGLSTEGDVYCWGLNSSYQLGDGTTDQRARPVPLPGGIVFESIDAGGNYTCGLAQDSAAWCWGRGLDGHAGTIEGFAAPVAEGIRFTSIAGGGHSCGSTSQGLLCWFPGANPSAIPNVSPAHASGGHTICATGTDFQTYCWGTIWVNTNSGNTPVAKSSASTPTVVQQSTSYRKLSIGTDHACGLRLTGVVECWGGQAVNFPVNTNYGEIGTYTPSHTPVPIAAASPSTDIAVGGRFTCSLRPSGQIYCWGRNHNSELGGGTTEITSAVPVLLPGGHIFVTVTAGFSHACAITSDRAIYCWGSNTFGQIGNGVAGGVAAAPVRVREPLP